VREEFPWATLVANDRNAGYGAAANQAVARCAADAVVVLNCDTRLERGAIRSLAAYLDANPRVAAVGPRLVNADGSLQPSCFPFPGTFAWLIDNDVVARYAGAVPGQGRRALRSWDHSYARAVPWVKGAALALRREAFAALGGFDERFFLYYEETDLCYRLWAAGWEVHFAPVTTVVHLGGESTRRYRTAMRVQLLESLATFYRHHYPVPRRLVLATTWKGILAARLVRDRARLLTAHDVRSRAAIASDVAAWEWALLGRAPTRQ
jgi:GT2 family glycosyltransferase